MEWCQTACIVWLALACTTIGVSNVRSDRVGDVVHEQNLSVPTRGCKCRPHGEQEVLEGWIFDGCARREAQLVYTCGTHIIRDCIQRLHW